MAVLLELLREATDFLSSSGIEEAKCDGEWLFAHILGCSRTELILNCRTTIPPEVEMQFRKLLERRATREPLQYILSEVDFCDVKLKVDPRVLIPRSETEMLVEWLSKKIEFVNNMQRKNKNLQILDLGTGSGAIALSLAKRYPNSRIIAIDQSSRALEIARENAALNHITHVEFLESNWFSALFGRENANFDVIVSNPPYLTQQEFDSAQDEVRKYEPVEALVSGNEGLQDLQLILDNAPQFLEQNGLVALEMGVNHSEILQKKYKKMFRKIEILQDLSKRNRFFMAYG
jgi:release factor glutamine methyltransferase